MTINIIAIEPPVFFFLDQSVLKHNNKPPYNNETTTNTLKPSFGKNKDIIGIRNINIIAIDLQIIFFGQSLIKHNNKTPLSIPKHISDTNELQK